MRTKNAKTITSAESAHMARVKESGCAVCGAGGVVEAHHTKQVMRAETIKKADMKAEMAKLPDAALAALANDAQRRADRLQREAAREQRVADMARKVMRARRKDAMPRMLP